MFAPEHYFDFADDPLFKQVFKGVQYVWDPLGALDFCIETVMDSVSRNAQQTDALAGLRFAEMSTPNPKKLVQGFVVENWLEIKQTVFFPETEIFIGKGTVLEPTAIIKGPAVIGEECDIRQGAYIRGNAIIGNHCTIGHTTEIKNSILMHHTETGHFNYIGDSILGSHVNLGAGTKLANLQFRTPEEKKTGNIRNVVVRVDGADRDTRLQKLGAVLGDYVEMGCNSVACPGAFIGKDSWVYPNTTVAKGYYPPRSFIGPADRKPRVQSRGA
jgi:carbonic anhydrase/acetyltransferase-like protein (isoleucine patch superfamily)